MKQENCKYCVERLPHAPTHSQRGQSAVLEKSTKWQVGSEIKIAFEMGTEQWQKDIVMTAWHEWTQYANLKPVVWSRWTEADVRVSFKRGAGSWSYVGTDVQYVPTTEATMNFGWLDMEVARHEVGHAIGLVHEHQHPEGGLKWNENVVVEELAGPPNYWTEAEIWRNVLDRYSKEQTNYSAFDKRSIMLYPFPSNWTLDGFSSKSNEVLSDTDKAFVARIYPYPAVQEVDKEVLELMQRVFRTTRDLWRMPERMLVEFARALGIDATVDDWKRDTINKLATVLKLEQ